MGSRVVPIRIFLAFFFGLMLCVAAKAQYNDAGLWASLNLEAKLVKKVSANIAQEFRFNENISELGTAFTDVGLSYKLNKHVQVAANFRFTQKRRIDDSYSLKHRVYVDVKYEKKAKPIQIVFRSRFQDEYSDIGRASDAGIPNYYLRNKLTFELDLDKAYMPYVSVELFSPLNNPREYLFDNIRSSAGIEYSLTKKQKIDLYYMIQRELNVSRPQIDFILGIGYSFKL